MVRLEETHAKGTPALHVETDDVAFEVATSIGPRVLRLCFPGEPNVFASVPGRGLALPDGRRFSFYGGHRLWEAPEVPARTYEPDDLPVAIEELRGGVRVTGPVSPAGIEKAIEIAVQPHRAALTVDHVITNHSGERLELAPWAITQLAPGGTGLLPLPIAPSEPSGTQANASVVLWSYSGLDDPGVRFRHRLLLIDGSRPEPFKVGTQISRGWLAYVRGWHVFVKRVAHRAGEAYADLGASGQVYCDSRFLELETLGPLTILDEGESARHRERWELHRLDDSDIPPDEVPAHLGLDDGV